MHIKITDFLPPQTLPARRECKGMAATLREGTAPKLENGKCVAWVGETIASRTGKPGNASIGAANPASSDSPFTNPARKEHGALILPLFIPLRSEWYLRFRAGSKDTEYRPYGPHWNERTCWTGRPVTLSRGYGKQERLYGRIKGFAVLDQAPDSEAWQSVYGDRKCKVAAITITDIDDEK